MERKLILYIASSMDGFIAAPNDDLSFLSIVERPGEDYGYAAFIKTIDTVIMGRKTYDRVMNQVPEFPHADKNTFVITRSSRSAIGNTTFYNGNLKDLVIKLKSGPGKNIFCDGGASIVNALLKDNLVDEFIISIIPMLLGSGIKLFTDGYAGMQLEMIAAKNFESGLLQLHYKRRF